MDSFQFQGKEMQRVLTNLKTINKWLGGNNITLSGIKQLLRNSPSEKTITILDIGCGDGELLRICAKVLEKQGLTCKFIGVDANEFILDEAKKRSAEFRNITFIKMDAFSEETSKIEFDIGLCTLFLHHFKNDEIVTIMKKYAQNAKIGMVINDLQRNRIAFFLFKIVSTLLLLTKTARNDGLVSIARGFRKEELKQFSKGITGKHSIGWKWAFRYQWIIKTI